MTAGFMGCKPDDGTIEPDPVETQEITVTINHKAGDQDFNFDSEITLPSDEVVTFRRLAYILSDFHLIKNDDTKEFLVDQYAFVDERLGTSFTLKDVPMGDYKAIGFSIGLDSTTNHGNPNFYSTDHPLSPINNSLHWDWSNGYIFTAIEGKTKADNESFLFHLAGYKNKTDFELPINFTKSFKSLNADLDYNILEVFENPEIYTISIDGKSTHTISSPVTIKLFNNLKDVFSINSISE
jgi:hypothetical protein